MKTDIYAQSMTGILQYLGKRLVMLAAKLAGFKSLCFMLATVLLIKGVIDQYIWLYAMITVVCNTSGLRIADAMGFRTGFYTRTVRGGDDSDEEEYSGEDTEPYTADSTGTYGGSTAEPAHGARRTAGTSTGADAIAAGKERIRALLDRRRGTAQ